MPKQGTPTRRRAGATPLRDLLVAHWDHKMTYWRIEGHPYPFEQALKSGADVVVDADRLDNGGADAGRVWLLGADDTLTLIDDRHVADLGQREFDELVAGLGTSRTLAWDADDPQAAVAAYAALTAAIRVAMG